MLRTIVSSCKVSLSNNAINKAYPAIAVGSYRMGSSSVPKVSDQAKAEGKKALDAVTSVVGRQGGFYHEPDYNSEPFIQKYVTFFDRKEIDSWEIRRAFQDFADFDFVPDPQISIAALKACRRLNDYALAIRYLELVKIKCGRKVNQWWPYIVQEIRPTLDQLGIETPEELGYDKPELAVKDVDDIH